MAYLRAVGLVVLLLLLPGMAISQQTSTQSNVLSDARGDVRYVALVEAPPQDTGVEQSVDLIALHIEETATELRFLVQVQELDPEDQTAVLSEGRIALEFLLGDTTITYVPEGADDPEEEQVTVARDRFRLDLHHVGGSASATLSRYDIARDQFVDHYQACTTERCENRMEVRTETATWVVPVPRDQIQDADGAVPSPALSLNSFLASSTGVTSGPSFGLVQMQDEMPDDGVPAGEFVPEFGLPPQSGHLRLQAPFPVRWSNGEQTAYVYDVTLNNSATEADEVTLSTRDVPAGWEVHLPGTSLLVKGGQKIHLQLMVDVPFAHRHSAYQAFALEAHSASDPGAVGRVELGVRFSEVPQPTGHHSRIWVHAAPPSGGSGAIESEIDGRQRTDEHFMSALAPDDHPGSDEDAYILPDGRQASFDTVEYTWWIDLEPPLRTGFDFDLQRTGLVQFPVIVENGARDAVIFGTLYHRPPMKPDQQNSVGPEQGATILGTFQSSQRVDIPADEATTLFGTFRPADAADYVPNRPEGAHVFLELNLRMDERTEYRVNGPLFGPMLVPGGTIDLPLDEYHDSVDIFYQPLNDVSITVVGDTKQYVNSGASALFTFRLNNSGVANEVFDLRATSLGAEWVTILGDGTVEVPSNGQQEIEMLVTAPQDAWQGQIVGPVLEVISLNDPYARASVRVHVEVDDEEPHPDMSHLLPEEVRLDGSRATPSVGLAAIVGVLAAALLSRRTRRL